jgi:hypothetical protein
MRSAEIVRRYAELWAWMDAHLDTGDWRARARKSRVNEVAAAIRRYLDTLPAAQRPAILQRMEVTVREIETTEAAMDSVVLEMDWSPGRADKPRPHCPCSQHIAASPCPLLFREIGFGPKTDPADRATREELARCPLQQPHGLALRMVAPKGDLKKWWRRRETEPAIGLVMWPGRPPESQEYALAEGKTVPQMMRDAKSQLHAWRVATGAPAAPATVFMPSAAVQERVRRALLDEARQKR